MNNFGYNKYINHIHLLIQLFYNLTRSKLCDDFLNVVFFFYKPLDLKKLKSS